MAHWNAYYESSQTSDDQYPSLSTTVSAAASQKNLMSLHFVLYMDSCCQIIGVLQLFLVTKRRGYTLTRNPQLYNNCANNHVWYEVVSAIACTHIWPMAHLQQTVAHIRARSCYAPYILAE